MTLRRSAVDLVAVAMFALVVTVAAVISSSSETPPRMVDGLPVMTVGEVLEARAAGGLRSQPVAVGGYWSERSVGRMGGDPEALSQMGPLEIPGVVPVAGITEREEPIAELDGLSITEAAGPHLLPWFPDGIKRALSLPFIDGGWFPPVPIVVVGHFDDPRAADCRPQARQECLDRLVVDRIVEFDPGVVASLPPEFVEWVQGDSSATE